MTIIWLDANLAPPLAGWIQDNFGVEARSAEQLALRHASDSRIFREAAAAGAIIMTRDKDFVVMATASRARVPVIWLRCGNASTARLRELLAGALAAAVESISEGALVVEITG